MEGTVISDAVNLASRMEGTTKMYGASLLISEHTFRRLSEPDRYLIRLIDRVAMKGKAEPVTVYEILNGEPKDVREKKLSLRKPYIFVDRECLPTSPGGSLAVQGAVLNRLGQMRRSDSRFPCQVRNGARHFPDAIMGPGAQPVMPHRLGEQPLLRRGQRTVAPQFPHAHGGIMRNGRARKAPVLPRPRRIHARADGRQASAAVVEARSVYCTGGTSI